MTAPWTLAREAEIRGRIEARLAYVMVDDRDFSDDALRDLPDALAEIVRLRGVIEGAPHDAHCIYERDRNTKAAGDRRPCNCWRRVALEGK
jgi:hypothetical protein